MHSACAAYLLNTWSLLIFCTSVFCTSTYDVAMSKDYVYWAGYTEGVYYDICAIGVKL